MLSAERIVAAVARLEPESRALVELSARRGMSADEIADVLAVQPHDVSRRLDDAVAALAEELELGSGGRDEVGRRLEELDEADWSGEAKPAKEKAAGREAAASGSGAGGSGAGRTGAARTSARSKPGTARDAGATGAGGGASATPDRRPFYFALAGLICIVAAVAIVLAASGGDGGGGSGGGDEGREERATPDRGGGDTTETDEIATEAAGPVRPMERLNGTYGRGTAQIVGDTEPARLRLRVSEFLKPQGGGYAVWLSNSPDDARRLYATAETSIERDIRLPSDAADYKFVEVARAVPDLNSDHSGLSLLRVPLAELRP